MIKMDKPTAQKWFKSKEKFTCCQNQHLLLLDVGQHCPTANGELAETVSEFLLNLSLSESSDI